MRTEFYELPLCEFVELGPESNMMQTGSDWGETGMPGSDLEPLTPIEF